MGRVRCGALRGSERDVRDDLGLEIAFRSWKRRGRLVDPDLRRHGWRARSSAEARPAQGVQSSTESRKLVSRWVQIVPSTTVSRPKRVTPFGTYRCATMVALRLNPTFSPT